MSIKVMINKVHKRWLKQSSILKTFKVEENKKRGISCRMVLQVSTLRDKHMFKQTVNSLFFSLSFGLENEEKHMVNMD